MGIEKIEVLTCICDRCKKTLGEGNFAFYFEDESTAEDQMKESEWVEINGKWYCYDCYEMDMETNEATIKK